MRRRFATTFAATLAFGCGSALAQGGDLTGVTMRVLDDVSDIDAVILELDANRGEGDEEAGRDGGESAEQADAAEPSATEAEEQGERGEREDLHEPADDERGEGRLEDDDVERPAVEPPA
jgi:hypothetical protein